MFGYWVVDLGYEDPDSDFEDDQFNHIAGQRSESSGFGFGTRDLQYYFKSKRQAAWVLDAVSEHLGLDEGGCPSERYASMYWEAKWYWLLLIQKRDWDELRRYLTRR
jgi:hypothetical protein